MSDLERVKRDTSGAGEARSQADAALVARMAALKRALFQSRWQSVADYGPCWCRVNAASPDEHTALCQTLSAALAVDYEQDIAKGPNHPHDGYAYDGCKCVCCLNVRVLTRLLIDPARPGRRRG